MALAKENSLLLGLGVAAAVYAVHQNITPNLADVRAAATGDGDVSSTERVATAIGLGLAGGVALLAQDATVFIIGGSMAVAMAWAYRHANTVNPDTGRVTAMQSREAVEAAMDPSVVDVAA